MKIRVSLFNKGKKSSHEVLSLTIWVVGAIVVSASVGADDGVEVGGAVIVGT